jgi:prolyl-tRNA synthetase
VHFPALIPQEIFEASGRWSDYGDSLFRLTDRKGGGYLLGPTHEELFTLMVKGEYSSYKDLPLTL